MFVGQCPNAMIHSLGYVQEMALILTLDKLSGFKNA